MEIKIPTEVCDDCGELLTEGAATPFVIVVQNGRVTGKWCVSCFTDKLMKKLKDIGGEVVDKVIDELWG